MSNPTYEPLCVSDATNSFGQGRLTIHAWEALVELGDFRPDYLHLRRPVASVG